MPDGVIEEIDTRKTSEALLIKPIN